LADFAQILLLPPPTPYPQRLPLPSTGRESELAVNAETQGDAATRAKRFRFRVYDGNESSEASLTTETRRSGSRGALTDRGSTEDATAQSSSGRIRYGSSESRSGSASAFLAQAFAQEELGEGLHNPPFATATAAYSRTGAALNPRATAGLDIRA
jgi:hypothetical protein